MGQTPTILRWKRDMTQHPVRPAASDDHGMRSAGQRRLPPSVRHPLASLDASQGAANAAQQDGLPRQERFQAATDATLRHALPEMVASHAFGGAGQGQASRRARDGVTVRRDEDDERDGSASDASSTAPMPLDSGTGHAAVSAEDDAAPLSVAPTSAGSGEAAAALDKTGTTDTAAPPDTNDRDRSLLPLWWTAAGGAAVALAGSGGGGSSGSSAPPRAPVADRGDAGHIAPEAAAPVEPAPGAGVQAPAPEASPMPPASESTAPSPSPSPSPPIQALPPLPPPTLTSIRDVSGQDLPIVRGMAVAGASLEVVWPDGSRSTTVADGEGRWTAVSTSAQGSGMVTIIATVDQQSSQTQAFYQDVTPPPIGQLQLVDFQDTGRSALDRLTSYKAFALAATGLDGGSTLSFERSGDGGASWAAMPAQAGDLADGDHLLRAVATDAAGNQARTAAVAVSLDSTAPVAGPIRLLGWVTREIGSNVTPVGHFTLTLDDREAGSTCRFEVSLDDGATWQPTSAQQRDLPDGSYRFRAVVSDAAGNETQVHLPTLTVDASAPVLGALRVLGAAGVAENEIGAVSRSGDLTLSATAGDGVSVRYERSADGGQHWQATSSAITGLSAGDYLFRAIATDGAGNETFSTSVPFSVRQTPPAPQGRLDLVGYAGTGDADAGYSGAATDLRLGPVSTDATAMLRYEVSTDGLNWRPCEADMTGVLDGRYQFRAVAVDAAGQSSQSNIVMVTVDSTLSGSAGTLTLVDFVDTGRSAMDRNTADNAFRVVATGQPPNTTTTIEWSRDGGSHWDILDPAVAQFPDGPLVFRARVEDQDGVVRYTRSIEVMVDRVPPKVSGVRLGLTDYEDTGISADDRVSQDRDFSLSLIGAAGSAAVSYEVSLDNGRSWLKTVATQSGLADGDYLFRALLTDAAGNIGYTASMSVTVDRQPPVDSRLVLNDWTDTGLALDGISSDRSFQLGIEGASAGAQVQRQRSVDGGQTWQDTDTRQDDLADGDYLYRAQVTDLAGNVFVTPQLAVRVDLTPPEPGEAVASGLAGAGWLRAGGSLELQLQGQEAGTDVAWQVWMDGSARWQPVTDRIDALPEGHYRFRAVVTDAAGNLALSNELIVTAVAPGSAAPSPLTGLALAGPADGSDDVLAGFLSGDGAEPAPSADAPSALLLGGMGAAPWDAHPPLANAAVL